MNGVINIDDLRKSLAQFIKDNDAFRYKEELGTGPRVYYIAGHGQLLDTV